MASELREKVAEIYQATYDDMLKFVVSRCRNPSDVPDILQNTYLCFFRRLKKRGDVRDPKSYLYRIARHELFKSYGVWRRDSGNIPAFSGQEGENFDDIEAELQTETDDASMSSGEIWASVRKGDVLTFKIFVLYFGYDEKLCDIARLLHISESNVKNRLYRTVRKIREEFRLEREAGS